MKRKPTKQTDKYTCSRHQQHDWEVERETNTHTVKVCKKCKGHQYTVRKD